MLNTREKNQGVSFAVRVTPRSSRNQINGVAGGVLGVKLTAPPVEGAANKALVKLMAGILGVAKSRVKVTAGHKSRNKTLWVDGLGAGELIRLLAL